MKFEDITNTFTVLGSGLSGITVAKTLIANGKQVTLIDYGLKNSDFFENENYQKHFSSPKFLIKEKKYSYSSFLQLTNIVSKNFKAVGSLAFGGLSNIWGAVLNPYNSNDLKTFPYDIDEVEDDYNYVGELLTKKKFQYPDESLISTNIDIDERCKKLINEDWNENIKFENPFIAYQSLNKNGNADHDTKYINNKFLFNAQDELNDLMMIKSFKYLDGNFIEGIKKFDGSYLIHTKNLNTKEQKIFKTNIIFCCLGTLSTTKLILKMEKAYNTELPLLNTPAMSMIFYTPLINKRLSTAKWFFSNLSFIVSLNKKTFYGNLFPVTKNLVEEIVKPKIFFKFIFKLLNYFLFSRLFIGNLFFSSEYSKNKIYLNSNDKLILNGDKSESLNKVLKIQLLK